MVDLPREPAASVAPGRGDVLVAGVLRALLPSVELGREQDLAGDGAAIVLRDEEARVDIGLDEVRQAAERRVTVVERVDQVAGAVEDRQGHLSQVRPGK
jgi:hypothetical protein